MTSSRNLDLPDRSSWIALTREPRDWRHSFGPSNSPVVLAGSSPQVRSLIGDIRDFGQRSARQTLIVEGGPGSGKSLTAAAFQAACQSRDATVAFVNDGSDPSLVIAKVNDARSLIVDNLDRLTVGIRNTLFERRHSAPDGTLITASRLSSVERELLGSADRHHQLGRWEDRPWDLLIVASMMWREMGLEPDLPDLCAEDVPGAIVGCPWAKGGNSIRRFIGLLAEALSVEGYFERAPRVIGLSDVTPALLAVIREDRPPEDEEVARIVVEGRTDAMYLEAAARLAGQAWGTDLLSGCRVAPPGEDRQGGAGKVVPELIALEKQGIIAVGLFDRDEPGRSAAKDAGKYTSQKTYVLPEEFDPLGNRKGTGEVEIEDLVSPALITRFYEENIGFEPDERTTRGRLTRIVVGGAHKGEAAAWLCKNASFEDMVKVVCVLCMLRQSLRLPVPPAALPLEAWISNLGMTTAAPR